MVFLWVNKVKNKKSCAIAQLGAITEFSSANVVQILWFFITAELH